MSRLQIQAPLRSTDGRLRLPSAFLPTSRAVFADREQNAFTNVANATAATLRSAAGVAVALGQPSEDEASAAYEVDQAEFLRLKGAYDRTDFETEQRQMAADALTAYAESIDGKYNTPGNRFRAEGQALREQALNIVFAEQKANDEETLKRAQRVAVGKFNDQMLSFAGSTVLDKELMGEYLDLAMQDPKAVGLAVVEDFKATLPPNVLEEYEQNPQMQRSLMSQAGRVQDQIFSMVATERSKARDYLAMEEERTQLTRFTTEEDFGTADFLEGVPAAQHEERLSKLSKHLKSTLSAPPVDGVDLQQVVAAKKAEDLRESYLAQGRPDLAEPIGEGLKAYYGHRSQDIIDMYEPENLEVVNDEFIADFEKSALTAVEAALGADTEGYASLVEAQAALKGGLGDNLLTRLTGYKAVLERMKGESLSLSDRLKRYEAGSEKGDPELLMANVVMKKPEEALEYIEDRLNLIGTVEATPFLEDARQIVRQARNEIQSGGLTDETHSNLAVVGSFTDARKIGAERSIDLSDTARAMVGLIGDGRHVGLRHAQAFMRGLGSQQAEFLRHIGERNPDVANALGRMASEDTSGMGAQELEALYQRRREQYLQMDSAIELSNQDRSDRKQVSDLFSDQRFLKGVADRVNEDFTSVDASADNILRYYSIPDQVEDVSLAGETVADRVASLGFQLFVENGALKAIAEIPSPRGFRATPAGLGVSPSEVRRVALGNTKLNTRLAEMLYNEIGQESQGNFQKAIADYLMARTPNRFVNSDGDRVTDPEMARKIVREALDSGQMTPTFSYTQQGVALRIDYQPSSLVDGRPVSQPGFEIPVFTFVWGGTIPEDWPVSLTPPTPEVLQGVGEGLLGTAAIRQAQGTPDPAREPQEQPTGFWKLLQKGRYYE